MGTTFLLILFFGDGLPVQTIPTRDRIHCQAVAIRELHKEAKRATCIKFK